MELSSSFAPSPMLLHDHYVRDDLCDGVSVASAGEIRSVGLVIFIGELCGSSGKTAD